MTDAVERVRELIEGAITRAADTGEAQAVDVSDVFTGVDGDDLTPVTDAQRAIDAAVRGTALTGYVVVVPSAEARMGPRLVVVIRGVG